jgi:phenylpyruvate tautomerase PptA (4-oxalocrotonate tautomerase family)
MDGPSREVYLRFGADLEGYELPDAYLAASAGELVVEQNADFPDELARQLADATGTVFDSPAGRTWVRLRTLLLDRYAENGGAPADLRPVFVAVTLATLPELPERTDLAARLALAVAGVLERPVEHIHVFFEPSAAGRIAFGGNLVAE